jgi:hypothetical protein
MRASASPSAGKPVRLFPGDSRAMQGVTSGPSLFRLWIARYERWQPGRWNDVPPQATALELVDDVAYSAAEAALFLQGFNSAILGSVRPIWAVAVPVELRYEGDARPGEPVQGFAFAEDVAALQSPALS